MIAEIVAKGVPSKIHIFWYARRTMQVKWGNVVVSCKQ